MLVETAPLVEEGTNRVVGSAQSGSPSRGLADLATLRLVLSGESFLDHNRCWFPDRTAVDDFLRLHQFDTDNPLDLGRLRELHAEATVYLTETHRYHMPPDVTEVEEIHDLFLAASHHTSGRARRMACMTLKVMHILHHLASREIVYATAMSEAELFARLNTKVFRVLDEMRGIGIAIDEFTTGAKRRSSLVTKLLAKHTASVNQVYDKMRFRVVLHSRDDLVLALLYLMRHLTPFNFLVPGESQNGLISRDDVARVLDVAPSLVNANWYAAAGSADSAVPTPRNAFSGTTYRCVNFVADIPVRIDDVAATQPPAIAAVQAEIQLVDAAAALANDQGENAHDLYKKRQREFVRHRLEGTAVGSADETDEDEAPLD